MELSEEKFVQSFSVVFYHLTQDIIFKNIVFKIFGPQPSKQL